jgi:hypothetical protein
MPTLKYWPAIALHENVLQYNKREQIILGEDNIYLNIHSNSNKLKE